MRATSASVLGALVVLAVNTVEASPLGGFPTYSPPGFGGGGGGAFPTFSRPGFGGGGGGGFPTFSFPGAPTSTAGGAPAPTSTGGSGGSGQTCSSYTIIEARGTGEAQGPSAGFRTMNQNILSKVSGGKEYDVVYPAGADQNSAQGTTDMVNHVQADTSSCYILQGYSQGAAATVNAMSKLTGAAFDAVKGVVLVGDPLKKAGLACNVDPNGGATTRNTNGIEAGGFGGGGGIPANWVSKVLDICISGDGVCDGGGGITPPHLTYGSNSGVQTEGANFAVAMLQGQPYTHQ